MNQIEVAEAAFKPLRPDARREVTNSAYKIIVNAELAARLEKTRRLQRARMAVALAVSSVVR